VDAPKIQAEGELERAGSTRYRYGTHVLVYPGDREIRFVLRSETVQLREFEGQPVRINASLVEDFVPDEGDPKLLDVFTITSLEQD
jgi:hypothetical protein